MKADRKKTIHKDKGFSVPDTRRKIINPTYEELTELPYYKEGPVHTGFIDLDPVAKIFGNDNPTSEQKNNFMEWMRENISSEIFPDESKNT